jgi:bifunctional N-acetylglucosamine-1-phosphate-uridyltransferase/glucosamine-1-phosphate-acetyltransferase GlmU-like protein
MEEKSRKKLSVVILAAGMGTRMKSARTKVMHEVSGMPMVEVVLNVARKITSEICVVVVYVKQFVLLVPSIALFLFAQLHCLL